MVSYLVHYDTLLQNVAHIITKCDGYFITKCDKSLLRNASDFLLQNATVIVRCDVCYKMCHYIRAIDKATELSSVITI